MNAWKKVLERIAWSGLLVSVLPGISLPATAQQTAAAKTREVSGATQNQQHQLNRNAVTNSGDESNSGDLPESPGAMLAKSGAGVNQQNMEFQSSSRASSQSPEAQTPSPPQRPVGTAAAEVPNVTGVAASQPAGVAIAPAKQHRVRTIVLRMGAIVGAGVAVGSVVALTSATPSKPPGAH